MKKARETYTIEQAMANYTNDISLYRNTSKSNVVETFIKIIHDRFEFSDLMSIMDEYSPTDGRFKS
jgi:hypothetical protein